MAAVLKAKAPYVPELCASGSFVVLLVTDMLFSAAAISSSVVVGVSFTLFSEMITGFSNASPLSAAANDWSVGAAEELVGSVVVVSVGVFVGSLVVALVASLAVPRVRSLVAALSFAYASDVTGKLNVNVTHKKTATAARIFREQRVILRSLTLFMLHVFK